jgi:hypothetical protein
VHGCERRERSGGRHYRRAGRQRHGCAVRSIVQAHAPDTPAAKTALTNPAALSTRVGLMVSSSLQVESAARPCTGRGRNFR